MFNFFLIVGIIAIFIASTLIGSDGRQHRNHHFTETKEDRELNIKLSTITGLTGIVSLAIAAIIYYLTN
ncbi:DUF5316 family protein [Niallia alba]|uniref:Uncharacterized protein n=1 Tax=Niallia circulans TaxID=1397 RepID=A0A941GIY1_NIACI|nr:DUF5316 family protein [Niallia circulans]MCB5236942.1 DUF5316 domain-containing protein [Niallia circulans]